MMVGRDFVLPPGHPVLAGHFPGHPIVPGTILMAWCEILGAELAGKPAVAARWSNVKFLQALKPGATCRVTLDNGPDSGAQALTVFRIVEGDTLIATGRIEWNIEPDSE